MRDGGDQAHRLVVGCEGGSRGDLGRHVLGAAWFHITINADAGDDTIPAEDGDDPWWTLEALPTWEEVARWHAWDWLS